MVIAFLALYCVRSYIILERISGWQRCSNMGHTCRPWMRVFTVSTEALGAASVSLSPVRGAIADFFRSPLTAEPEEISSMCGVDFSLVLTRLVAAGRDRGDAAVEGV